MALETAPAFDFVFGLMRSLDSDKYYSQPAASSVQNELP